MMIRLYFYGTFLLQFCFLLVVLIGCTSRTTKAPDTFMNAIESSKPWDHSRQVAILEAYRAADTQRQHAYRKALVERVLSEQDHALARHLFIITFHDRWFEERPEMRPAIEAMMVHLNHLAEEQGKSSKYRILIIDGREILTERVGVN